MLWLAGSALSPCAVCRRTMTACSPFHTKNRALVVLMADYVRAGKNTQNATLLLATGYTSGPFTPLAVRISA